VSISKIEDHVERGLARLPFQFRDKPKLKAFLTVLMTPAQPIEDALWQLLTERDIDNAEGEQLDQIGVIVGLGRTSTDDEVYRRHLRAQILTNKSNGNVNDLIRIAKAALADVNPGIEVRRQNNVTAVVRVRETAIDSDTAEILIEFLNRARAAGVRVILEWAESAPEDVFTLNTGPGLDQGHLAGARDQ
jgi:hypothetical protein